MAWAVYCPACGELAVAPNGCKCGYVVIDESGTVFTRDFTSDPNFRRPAPNMVVRSTEEWERLAEQVKAEQAESAEGGAEDEVREGRTSPRRHTGSGT